MIVIVLQLNMIQFSMKNLKFQIYVEYRSDVVRFVILKSKRVGECEMLNENMRELVFLPSGYF